MPAPELARGANLRRRFLTLLLQFPILAQIATGHASRPAGALAESAPAHKSSQVDQDAQAGVGSLSQELAQDLKVLHQVLLPAFRKLSSETGVDLLLDDPCWIETSTQFRIGK
jgi:hypothetical protein